MCLRNDSPRTLSRKKTIITIITSLVLVVGILISADYLYTQNVRDRKEYVSLANVKNDEILFFYRDDCPHCRKVFPRVLHAKVVGGKKIKLINMNQQKNRKYISKYDLVTVPTYLKKNKKGRYVMYTGTAKSTLDEILNH